MSRRLPMNENPAPAATDGLRAGRSLVHDDDGMISLAAVVGLLIIVVMIGFLGNCIRAVQQKIEIQNAADAAAYSSALWMARGMNAVTATNHMIGELSALCVLHEAIGGPELDDDEAPTEKYVMYNQIIKRWEFAWSHLVPIDRVLLQQACPTLADDDGEDPIGGATLFDARMRLKWITANAVIGKIIANILEKTGFLTGLGMAIHATASAAIAECYKEYLILRYLQKAARAMTPLKQTIEDQGLMLLVEYEKKLAGQAGTRTPLVGQIRDTLEELKTRNGAEVAISPASRRLAMPIEEEEEPESGSGGKIPSNAGKTGLAGMVEDLFKRLGVAAEVAELVDVFLSDDDAGKLGNDLNSRSSIVNGPLDDGAPENPTREKVENLSADWEKEQTTQWTRATYPYVDTGRAPIVSTFESVLFCPLSMAGTYYTHWTNRFTLVKTWQFRAGERFSNRSASPMTLYVMRDSKPLERGLEPWTTDSREAERIFTLNGFARRDVETLFSPRVYKSPQPTNWVTTAQAIFYNANEQRPGAAGEKGETQPVVGWNTLNWADPSQIPEYGADPKDESGSDFFPWSLLKGWKDPPKVKLNWQAKLVPVTQLRLTDATSDADLKQNFRKPVSEIAPYTSNLDGH